MPFLSNPLPIMINSLFYIFLLFTFSISIVNPAKASNSGHHTLISSSDQNTDSLKTLTPADYSKWESLGYGGQLTQNGNWLIYPVNRNNDENELRLHNLGTDSVKVLKNGTRQEFSKDGKWLGYLVNPSAKERKKLKSQNKPIHTDLCILNLISGDSRIIKNVSAFNFSDNSLFVAFQLIPPKGSKQIGSDIVIQNMITRKNFSFGNVTEYRWQDKGSLLAIIVQTEGEVGNGVQLFNGENETIKLLDSEQAIYKGLSWRKESNDLSVYRSKVNEVYEDSTNVILIWKNLDNPPHYGSVL